MPGIVGLFTKLPPSRARRERDVMLRTLQHESFYSSGTWEDESAGAFLGWVARKGAPPEGMPLTGKYGRNTLIFSGEEFSHDGGAALLDQFERDCSFPSQWNGWFHGFAASRSRNSALLFNDRYGLHRLYVHESSNGVYFAAEAKAILAVRPELRSLDSQGLAEFLSCGCVLDNRSLFPGISLLPPGSAWTLEEGTIRRKASYFHLSEWRDQPPMELPAFHREIREVFSGALPRYFRRSGPAAVSLTGGLDTRLIMAWEPRDARAVRSYTFGGMYRDSQDVIIAQKVARACGCPHTVIPVGRTFLSRFAYHAERTVYLTDGCVDVSHSPDHYANQIARELAPVRLTGNYGGEVLRGLRALRFRKPAGGLFAEEFSRLISRVPETLAAGKLTSPLASVVFQDVPWYHQALLSLEQTQLTLRSPYLDNDLIRTLFRAPAAAFASDDVYFRLIAEGSPALRQIRTDGGRAVGPASVRTLAHSFWLELLRKAEYAFDYGMPQRMARLGRYLAPPGLERAFLGRNKFYHFRLWYRDPLAEYVRDVLLDSRSLSRSYLNRAGVEAAVSGHLAGAANYTLEIHKLLTVELLHRLVLEGRIA